MRELAIDFQLNHRHDGTSELKITDRLSGIVLMSSVLSTLESKTFMTGGTVNGGRGAIATVNDSDKLTRVGMYRWNAALNLNRVFDGDNRGSSQHSDQRLLNAIEDSELKPKGEAYHRVDRRNFGLTWIVYGYTYTAERAVQVAAAAAAEMEAWAINGEWKRPTIGETVQAGDASYFPIQASDMDDDEV
jgi:hypothetical protein